MRNANRRFVLKARPEGIAGPEHFTEDAVAVHSPESGEVLLETMYVSVDPAMRMDQRESLSATIEAAANGASPASDAPLHEIIEFGKKALRDKRSDELAFDLLGLDGVRLPLKSDTAPD